MVSVPYLNSISTKENKELNFDNIYCQYVSMNLQRGARSYSEYVGEIQLFFFYNINYMTLIVVYLPALFS